MRHWNPEVMGHMSPRVFNNFKPLIKAAILNFLNSAPPKRPVKSYTGGEPQYATDAPRREWVGLTDEEIKKVFEADWGRPNCPEWLVEFSKKIDAKLKEKNHD
jgi:hypothetical protein